MAWSKQRLGELLPGTEAAGSGGGWSARITAVTSVTGDVRVLHGGRPHVAATLACLLQGQLPRLHACIIHLRSSPTLPTLPMSQAMLTTRKGNKRCVEAVEGGPGLLHSPAGHLACRQRLALLHGLLPQHAALLLAGLLSTTSSFRWPGKPPRQRLPPTAALRRCRMRQQTARRRRSRRRRRPAGLWTSPNSGLAQTTTILKLLLPPRVRGRARREGGGKRGGGHLSTANGA